jgi:NAD dependent epimerase/dehydratase family
LTSALIGCSGFVGGSLAAAEPFDLLVNRSNLESLKGRSLDRLVCAGLPAAKWIANQKPDEDAHNIRRLEATLREVRSKSVLLISTIDVYPRTQSADETYDCRLEPNHAYGTNRLAFEHFIRDQFSYACIVRLPALFGRGLRKNVVYDLLHDNRLDRINQDSRFQWYPLQKLPSDLAIVEALGLRLVNLFTEPVETRRILELFPDKVTGQSPDPSAHYDLHTRHGIHFGGSEQYVMDRSAVLAALREFIRSERASQ